MRVNSTPPAQGHVYTWHANCVSFSRTRTLSHKIGAESSQMSDIQLLVIRVNVVFEIIQSFSLLSNFSLVLQGRIFILRN